jgi:glycosyltransferase involved in cell wall biosynthesis
MSLAALHVIAAVAPRYGGPSDAVLGACRALRARGCTTLIATTDADGPSGRLDVALGERQTYRDVPVIFFRRQLGESLKWSPALGAWLSEQAARFDVVDIHGVFSHTSIAAGNACRKAGVPYVVRPHGMLDPWSLGRHRVRKSVWLATSAGRLVKSAAAMQYTTPEERRLAESAIAGLPAGAVVPLGIEDDLFSEPATRASSASPYLLVLSRLDPKKRVDALIEAFHRLARVPGLAAWRLVIAGDGAPPYVRYLRRLGAAGEGRDRITFTGWVSGSEKTALLRAASLFAAPSFQENFGLSLLEAMALGVPVVLADRLDLARSVEAAGAGWRWIGGADLAGLLGDVMRDPAERARRGEAAARFARQFQWRQTVEPLIGLYERVVAAARPGGPAVETAVHA